MPSAPGGAVAYQCEGAGTVQGLPLKGGPSHVLPTQLCGACVLLYTSASPSRLRPWPRASRHGAYSFSYSQQWQ